MPALPDTGLMLDLSRLPAPAVLAPLDYEVIVADRLADLSERWPDYDALLESDPAVKLQQTDAWRELLTRAHINDAARAVMLAFATGADLDHLAAFYQVERRVIEPATQFAAAVLESDTELRARIQGAPEALPHAGVTGGFYRARVLAAVPALKDARAIKLGGGRVDLVVLSRVGNGAVLPEDLATVSALFADGETVQLTDILSVRSASIVPYSAAISLTIRRGPDPEAVRASADAAVRAFAADRHRIGAPVWRQMLSAAASVGGVERAEVTAPLADVDPGAAGAAWLSDLTFTTALAG